MIGAQRHYWGFDKLPRQPEIDRNHARYRASLRNRPMREHQNAFLRFWRHLNRTSAELGCDDVKCGVAWRLFVEAMAL